MAYSDVVLADSPLLYYRLEETSGTTITNAGSLGTNGTANGPTLGRPGIPGIPNGYAASFDGTNDRIEIATTNTFYNDKSWTVEAWIKCGTSLANEYNTITRRGSGGSYVLLRVRGSNTTNPNRVEAYVSTGTGSVTLITATNTVNDNAWHHVVLTADGTTIRLYLDGVQRDAKAYPAGTVSIATTQFLGCAENLSEWFAGTMDEIAFYGTALSASRITAHYQAGSAIPEPLVLQAGFRADISWGTALGATLDLSGPVVSALVLDAGFPAALTVGTAMGATLDMATGTTYKHVDTELERKRLSVNLSSNVIDMELPRKRLKMEVET